MIKPIPPADDFWKQMLDELNNTTEEEWSQFIEEYEKECKPMENVVELCCQIIDLLKDLNEPRFLRFDDVTIVTSYRMFDCYNDKYFKVFTKVYKDETLQLFIDKTTYYGVEYEVTNREIDKISFLQHIVELLKLRLERNKHE